MIETNKNEVIVLSDVEAGMSISEAVKCFGVSRQWVYTLIRRYQQDGLTGLQPRSRRPHRRPHQCPLHVVDHVLGLRATLIEQGLDGGAESIWARLDEHERPSVSTIWRISKSTTALCLSPTRNHDQHGNDSKPQHLMKCDNPTSRTGTFKPSKSRLSPGLMTTHVPPARKRTPAHHWPRRGGNLYHHDAHLRVPALHTDRQRHGLQHAPRARSTRPKPPAQRV